MGRLVGIEPTNARATIWCVNHFATAAIILKWQTNGGSGRNRTADTRIFSPLLYRLSYRAVLTIRRIETNFFKNGGLDGTRTRDLLRDRQAF